METADQSRKEKQREYKRKWYEANKEKILEKQRKQRAAKKTK
jgi:hypothetical protein